MAREASRQTSLGARRVDQGGRSPPPRGRVRTGFPIAVVGASAGGVEAFKRLLSTLPATSGTGFILVPHLNPTRESRLVRLLAGASAMPVTDAQQGRLIRPNHVYVIPPNRLLAVQRGRIALTSLPDRQAGRAALDVALRSLAEDQGANAVGIVLSGTGNHGAAGLEKILRAGGLALAQDPATALDDQMPRSAAAVGVPPQHVLPPESMAAVLLANAERLAEVPSGRRASPSRSGRFFHDSGVLDALANGALRGLVSRATAALPVRAWVPECGTGEEAYSVAILLLERLEAVPGGAALKVFATDSDPQSLRVARLGIYPRSIARAVSPERLARFFVRLPMGRYQVRAELRETLVFGRMDLIKDPPISRLDLIVCRARLGKLRPEEHARLISRLHFALKPGGYLLLGVGAPAVTAAGLFAAASEVIPLYRSSRPVPHPQARERTDLQAVLADLAHANEDLKASNEQMISVSEQLQSSNEEMQAMNEELESFRVSLQDRTEVSERVEAQLRAVLDATVDAVVTIKADGNIVTFNGAASRMFGYALDEVVGRNINMLMPPEMRALHNQYLARYRKTHERHAIGTSREVVAYRRDGTRFPALLSVSETAHAELVVGCLRDLSADKALQEEILHIAALEQQRIGQELHDGTQQELTGLGLLAQNLSEELQQERGSARAELARRLATGIAEANRHVRSLARGLVPVPVDADTLPAALGELARRTQETYKLSCRLDCPAPLRMPDAATATHLFRIAQEAAGNAAKHAKATEVLIRLANDDTRLRLEVNDNGTGIPQQPAVNGGVGLRLMEHRCAAIGGRFAIARREGGGTVVSCTLPFLGRS